MTLDLGAGLSRQNARLIRELDQLVIVVEPYRVVLNMARELIKELETLGAGPDRTSIVLVNRAPATLQVPWQEAEQILSHEMLAIIFTRARVGVSGCRSRNADCAFPAKRDHCQPDEQTGRRTRHARTCFRVGRRPVT